ncbi:HTH_Tnp_Tc3_2 domain-containing protein [Trichonephila clavipes]|nr:HTH_Tnp_Tc3_2 domain-containing protein [Trichonephila clavipes]
MDPQNFVAKLQQHMAELKPLKSPSNRKQNIFVHKDLKSCSHVFIHIDRVKKALEPPYEGPYAVQKKCNNHIVMAQRKHLDDFLRGRIIGLECGRTQLEVSEELGIAQSVISRLWQRFQDDVTANRNRRSKASDLSRQLSSATGTTVSRQTMYRRLGYIGLYACRPVRYVPLTATHCRLRLTWSREHALWTPQQWSRVMFSDESRFSLQCDSRQTLIWRVPGTRYHQENSGNVTVVQDSSFGEELFLVPELTCMFRV